MPLGPVAQQPRGFFLRSTWNLGYDARMALTPQQRIELGLDDPPAQPAPYKDGEFLPRSAAPTLADPQGYKPNLKLVLKDSDRATGPKIRGMVNELLAGNMQNADRALQQLFAINPKEALKLYVELAQFTLPTLKALAVAVDDRSEKPSTLTFAQLQALIQGDAPAT